MLTRGCGFRGELFRNSYADLKGCDFLPGAGCPRFESVFWTLTLGAAADVRLTACDFLARREGLTSCDLSS